MGSQAAEAMFISAIAVLDTQRGVSHAAHHIHGS